VLNALTLKLYVRPPVRPDAVQVVSNAAAPEQVTRVDGVPVEPSSMYRLYPVTATPVITTGADHDSIMLEVV